MESVEKRGRSLNKPPLSEVFMLVSRFLSLGCLVSTHGRCLYRRNRTFFGTDKRCVFDFWFLVTIRKLRSIEPIIFVWSVLLMEVMYISTVYTKLGFWFISF